MYLMGVQIPAHDGIILTAKMGWLRTRPDMSNGWVGILKATQQGQHWYSTDAELGVLYGVHISTRLNCLCAAAMRPYVVLL